MQSSARIGIGSIAVENAYNTVLRNNFPTRVKVVYSADDSLNYWSHMTKKFAELGVQIAVAKIHEL